MLSKKMTVSKLMEELKTNSSKWIKTKDDALRNFYWQEGYGAFSVTPDAIDRVAKYIENQQVHHQKVTFQTEFRTILKRYRVEYDERYVWD